MADFLAHELIGWDRRRGNFCPRRGGSARVPEIPLRTARSHCIPLSLSSSAIRALVPDV